MNAKKYGDVEIKQSGIEQFNDGLGVFACRNCKKGEELSMQEDFKEDF